ncbi:MAG: hypothetical protein KDA32_03230 [Phycisphaerales bacterium]|nr:hypothetical protein [Phycisphaerales bacterium]
MSVMAPIPRGGQVAVRDRVLEPLRRLRGRARAYLFVRGAVRVWLAFMLGGLGQLALDRWLRMPADQRVLFNVLLTAWWSFVIYRWLVRPIRAPLSDDELAAVVDHANPGMHDGLATAVQFARGEVGDEFSNSPRLIEETLREACARAQGVPFLGVLNHRGARQRLTELLSLFALTGAVWIMTPELMNTWFLRNWLLRDVAWPQQTQIIPVGFDESGAMRWPIGDELEIRADLYGKPPQRVLLDWRTTEGAGQVAMTMIGQSRLRASLGLMDTDVRFRIHGGDEETREFVVYAIERPRITRTSTRITPPAYTRREAVTVEQQTVFEALKGSRIEIDAWLNKSVSQAVFRSSDESIGEAEQVADDRISFVWDAPQSGSYSFLLRDADGWENRRPVRFTVRVEPDEAPRVSLALVGVSDAVTPAGVFDVALGFEDEFGLADARLSVQRNDDPAIGIPIGAIEAEARRYEHRAQIDASRLALKPGDRLRIWAEADDTDPAGPNTGRAEAPELRVLSAGEFAARIAEQELALRREFERALSAQRAIRDGLDRLAEELDPLTRPDEGQTQRASGLARRQEQQTAVIARVTDAYEQLLEEMRANRAARPSEERRLQDSLIDPLQRLSEDGMPAASSALEQVGSEGGAAVGAAADRQASVMRDMRDVLNNMREWEGFREAVAMLEEIIAEQESLRDTTVTAISDELDAILGLDDPEDGNP